MTRVILLTFACLGWAWFELSGGSDFQPGQNGVTLVASVSQSDLQPVEPASPQVARADTAATVLTSFSAPSPAKVIRVAAPVRTPKPVIAQNAVAQAIVTPAVATAPLFDIAASNKPLIAPESTTPDFSVLSDKPDLAGLLDTAGFAVLTDTPDLAVADYRRVTGSRVNLRGGPSTDYDVVTQLLRGEEVEVLANQDNGWVKLRALDGSDIGWMSDSFLKVVN